MAALAAVAPSSPGRAAAGDDPRDAGFVSALVSQVLETERTNVEVPWSNPETGNRGMVVVKRTFYRDETPCRDYVRTLEQPGGDPVVTRGTGCRLGAGRWELDDEEVVARGAPRAARPAPPRMPVPDAGPEPPPAATRSVAARPAAPTTAAAADAAADPAPTAAAGGDEWGDEGGGAAPPPETIVLPVGKPPAFTAYTLPSRTKL